MKGKTVEAPIQVKPAGEEWSPGCLWKTPGTMIPIQANDPVCGSWTLVHMSALVLMGSSPTASRQNPPKPPLEKERQLC